MEDFLKKYLDDYFKVLLKRLATLEMVVTILSTKLQDVQCREALAKFLEAADPPTVQPPNEKPFIDFRSTYQRILDHLAQTEKDTCINIAKAVDRSRDNVYMTMRRYIDDFEQVGNCWRLRKKTVFPGDLPLDPSKPDLS